MLSKKKDPKITASKSKSGLNAKKTSGTKTAKKSATESPKPLSRGIPIVLKFNKTAELDETDADFDDGESIGSIESEGFELGDEMLDTDEKEHSIASCSKCLALESRVKVLEQEIEQYKADGFMPSSEPRKLHYNNINFVAFDKKKKRVLTKTDVWCWWCDHPFSCMPWPLVENCIEQTLSDTGVKLPKPLRVYEIIGNFCSGSCAVAYNDDLADTKVDTRYNLMIKLYREIYGLSQDTPVNIPAAPHWSILKVKGGDQTIEQFRGKCLTHSEFIVYIPPMKPIQITIEEKSLLQSKGHTIKNTSGLKGMEHLLKR
jgi:hypothetical protein